MFQVFSIDDGNDDPRFIAGQAIEWLASDGAQNESEQNEAIVNFSHKRKSNGNFKYVWSKSYSANCAFWMCVCCWTHSNMEYWKFN